MRTAVALRKLLFTTVMILLALSICVPTILSAQTTAPTATVVSAGLNVRGGPGIGYTRIGVVTRNTVLPVIGQSQNCAWLKVTLDDGAEGWVSGGARYMRLNDVACSEIPAATAGSATASGATASGAAPNTAPAATPATPAQPAATSAPAAPTATPLPAPTATPTTAPTTAPATTETLPAGFGSDPLPADQACYLVQNFVGPELTITFTNQDSGQSTDFRVPSGGEVLKCIVPGRYTVTADAPPPWGTLNFSFTAYAGEREYMPFSARP